MKTSGANKITAFVKANYKPLLFFCFLFLLNIFFLFQNFSTNDLTFGKTFVVTLIGIIVLEIILCATLFLAKRQNWKIEKLFLVLSLAVGIFYVFALPPGRAPDEDSHFFRIHEIASGHIVSDLSDDGNAGSVAPTDITVIRDYARNNTTYSDILNSLGDYPDESDQSFVVTASDGYTPISFLPQVTGIVIGNVLGLPLLVSIYLAKLLNLLVCVLLLCFSIKYIPFFKKFLFFTAFLPITMQEMSSLAADGLAIATSIAFISFILYSIYTLKDKFTKKHLAILLIFCLCLTLGKMVYAALCLLLFAIPKERFGGNKKKLIYIFVFGAIAFAALLAWKLLCPPTRSVSDSSIQTAVILQHPLKYIAIIINSLSVNANIYVPGLFGGFLEWFNVALSPLYVIPSFVIFFFLCAKERQTAQSTKALSILSAAIFIIIALALFTFMFTQWTNTGENVIDGVQGRYFLPILLLIPIILAFHSPTTKSKAKTDPKAKAITSKVPAPKTVNLTTDLYLYGFIIFESIYAITTTACTHF